jgi:DNA topoisomerase-3
VAGPTRSQQAVEADGVGAQAPSLLGDVSCRGKAARGKAGGGGALPPTPAMKRYAVSLSQQKGIAPPVGYARSGAVCRAFLDQHAPGKGRAGEDVALPGAAWPVAEEATPQQLDTEGPGTAVADGQAPSPPRNRKGRAPAASTRKAAPAGHRTSPPPAQDRPRAGSGAAVPPEAGGTALRIPFGNKEAAQRLGARYGAGGWYAPPGVALDPFRERGWM